MGCNCSKNKQNDDQSRGSLEKEDSYKARVTLVPNIKNFKNLKYIEDINQIFDINNSNKLGSGAFGQVLRCKGK